MMGNDKAMAARCIGWVAAIVLGGWVAAAPADEPSAVHAAPVVTLRVEGAIGPATADYVRRGLERAEEQSAQLVVLEMDTPGGLDTAMRDIIKGVLASTVPVAGFVAPSGARAASAGTYILYACHVAAMAPATNLGAATPIAIGLPAPGSGPAAPKPGPSAEPAADAPAADAPAADAPAHEPHDAAEAKRINDAAAYIRGLAQLRGRNAEWGERAVREAVSLAASDALAERVIDLVAADVPDLLRRLDGRTLQAGGRDQVLATAGAPLTAVEPDWRDRLLAVISDPSVALVLMMIGVYGLLFEFMNPGMVAPGVIGGVCLLLGLFALQMLPVNYAGLGLIMLGIAFFVAEAFVPSFGVLGLGGVAAFAFGALLLIDSESPELGIPRPLIAVLTLTSAAVVIGIAGMAARARGRPVVSGPQTMLGATGVLLERDGGFGWARINGEQWHVRVAGEVPVGARVRVRSTKGLTLEVGPEIDSPQGG